MLKPKKYLPVRDKIFFTPLIKENLRLDFFSSENKLDDLSLLSALMLRAGKSVDDIAAVTLLPRDVIENVLDELKDQGLLGERNEVSEQTKQILELSNCINSFNMSPPPIFLDSLLKLPVLLPVGAKLEKSFDETNCAAKVKHCEQIPNVEFAEISNLVKKFLFEHGAKDFIDDLKVLRLDQKSEVLFATRKLHFLPVVGENNFNGCMTLNSEQTIAAELPVRKFVVKSEAGAQEIFVDLLLGTILTEPAVELEDSEEVTLSFKINPNFEGNEPAEKLAELYGEVVDAGIHYIGIEVASYVAGDFLCG